ncbi:Periplasmic [NiFe] hydrogenase large subunit [subsurface metagenome]
MARYEGTNPALNSIKNFIGRGELGPFFPRYEGDYRFPDEVDQQLVAHYVEALIMRRKGQEMLSIFGGKMPHNVGIVPGGVTEVPTVDKIASFLWRLNELRDFIDNVYLPDVLTVAEAYSDYFEIGKGCGNFISYGAYELDGKEADLTKRERLFRPGTISTDLKPDKLDPNKISEEVKNSWYASSTTGKNPAQGETQPDTSKAEAYSWIKSPRYDGKVYEAGPLSRVLVTYASGEPTLKALVDSTLARFSASPSALFSVLGRHAARALETKFIADSMPGWLLQIKPGEPVYIDYTMPEEAQGMGLTEAARGALGHWIEIKEGKIANYQVITPTSWNASPADDKNQPGPIEQALVGTKIRDEANPFEVVRIVRSFDPCLACAVHLITPKGRSLGEFRVS